MPVTVKVLGWNLMACFFFQTGSSPFHKRIVGFLMYAYVFSA